ncbi:PRC-barrel domain containing protein [Kitasatospora sp. NA04385]|uniref:PRC-barrel domain-containing protein n=1 Tax=Kitasatospora sp. NA04385 TaxID=2742135 RepID=UPI00159183DD|nr:PRC-barrel domain-containing protein [Kitasatospora sp. NA04385]QKW18233.1 PRC-barrel domain containing protein [Kitasatospora sp. NA04385]
MSEQSQQVDVWTYRDASGHEVGADLVGFHVEAADGPIGKVDRMAEDFGPQYLVVDTAPWIFHHRVLLPAVTVRQIDLEQRTVRVDRTKDEIKAAPPLVAEAHHDDLVLRTDLAVYYAPFYGNRLP